ncbi:MAG: hypothetical protein HOG34_11020 [Bacteroidetes bacterium]|nr:hypothetical protein [Bacteroidota bacterium]
MIIGSSCLKIGSGGSCKSGYCQQYPISPLFRQNHIHEHKKPCWQ